MSRGRHKRRSRRTRIIKHSRRLWEYRFASGLRLYFNPFQTVKIQTTETRSPKCKRRTAS